MPQCKLPVEFVVTGIPASAQTKNKQRLRDWRAEVRASATAAVTAGGGGSPVTTRVKVIVTYYFRGSERTQLDRDNMAKPMMDAMQQVVYVNDRQNRTEELHLLELDGEYKVSGMSPILASGFIGNEPFVHVRVEPYAHTGVLP